MFIECFFENAFIHLIQNKPPLGRTGHFWDPCLGMVDSNQSPQKQTKQEKTTINMWRKIYSGTTKSSWIIMNLIPNPKNPNLENLLKHMRNSVQVRPMPKGLCYLFAFRIGSPYLWGIPHFVQNKLVPPWSHLRNGLKKLHQDFGDFETQEIIMNDMGFHIGCLYGFTWFYMNVLWALSFSSIHWNGSIRASGWQTLTRLRICFVPKATTGEGIKTTRCTAYPRRNQLTMLVIPLDSWGVFFMYLTTEMVARFAASLLGVFLANGGCAGFMCWIICKHKWAKCKRNEFGLCIWVWIVGYDALPWKIRDLNTVLGLKLSKSVFQNANRRALDPFSSDS